MAIDGLPKKTGIRYAFIGVSFSSKLSEDQRENLTLLNNMLRARNNGAIYIPPLPVIKSDDIPHTMPIVGIILDSIRRHVDAHRRARAAAEQTAAKPLLCRSPPTVSRRTTTTMGTASFHPDAAMAKDNRPPSAHQVQSVILMTTHRHQGTVATSDRA